MQSHLEPVLEQAAQALALELSSEQKAKLLLYVKQLHRWNKTYNLTAIKDMREMLIQHIVDSLAVIAPLKAAVGDKKEGLYIVDVGSGAGLPGIVLAIMEPTWEVQCIDSVEKKTAFMQQMRGVLEVPNLTALHCRIQDVSPLQCDILISRAFSSLGNIIKWAGQHVVAGGVIAAMKGKLPNDELDEISHNASWQTELVTSIDVPFLDADRCLVLLKKQG